MRTWNPSARYVTTRGRNGAVPTTIEWVRNSDGSPGETFNPWVGCQKVSAACDNCYAEGMMDKRLGGDYTLNLPNPVDGTR